MEIRILLSKMKLTILLVFYSLVLNSQFEKEIILYSGDSYVNDVYAVDLDGNGLNDVIGSTEDEIILFKNNGKHKYSEIILEFDFGAGFYSSHAADLDGDGLLDIISSSNNEGHISWFKNLGHFNFSKEIIILDENHAKDIYVADIDNDGDQDVVISSGTNASNFSDNISWIKNEGNGRFGQKIVLTSDVNRCDAVYPFDIDNDGDLDIFATSLIDDKMIWIENLGDGNFSESETIARDLNGAQSLAIADLDKDGEWEVFISNRNNLRKSLAYISFLGNRQFSSVTYIPFFFFFIPSICLADLNHDNYFDICGVDDLGGRLAYKISNKDGTFRKRVIIKNNLQGASSVFVSDLDSDGDVEILYSAEKGRIIGYFINQFEDTKN